MPPKLKAKPIVMTVTSGPRGPPPVTVHVGQSGALNAAARAAGYTVKKK